MVYFKILFFIFYILDACKGPCELIIPKYMNHFQFDFYEDFTNPLKKFLESNGCNLNEENECFIDREFIFPEEIFFQPEI